MQARVAKLVGGVQEGLLALFVEGVGEVREEEVDNVSGQGRGVSLVGSRLKGARMGV